MHDTVSFTEWMSTPFKEDYSEIRIRTDASVITISSQGIVIAGNYFPMWCFVPSAVKNINTTLKEMREYLKPFLGVGVGKIYDAEDVHITTITHDTENVVRLAGPISGVAADHRSSLFTPIPVALAIA